MKRITSILLLVAAIFMIAATVPSGERFAFPGNMRVIDLTDTVVSTVDTIPDDGGFNIYGPYPVVMRTKEYPYSAVRLYFPAAAIRDGDSLAVEYQYLPDSTLTDTLTGEWVRNDTCLYAGLHTAAISLDGACSRSLVFKFTALGDTAIISKPIRAVFEY